MKTVVVVTTTHNTEQGVAVPTPVVEEVTIRKQKGAVILELHPRW